MLCICSGAWASPDALKQAAEQAAAGQWDAALLALQSVPDAADPRIESFKTLLLEHQALVERRQQQRLAVFEEKCQALDVPDPNIPGDEAAVLKAMSLFKSAWDNASAAERDHLLTRPIYHILRQAACDGFAADKQAGRWDAAWSRWLRWLAEFEPDAWKQVSDDLQERRAIASALRKNACDENAIPYSQVRHDTAARIFAILCDQYVDPVPFDRLAGQGLHRLFLLPEVLSNPTVPYAVRADPNGFSGWADHIEWLQFADPPISAAGIAAMLQTLTAVNQTTLKLPDGVIIAQFTEAALTALDPYTEAVWPEGVGLFEKSLTGRFGGVGLRIKKDGEHLVVVSVIPDTPAAGTSISADDIIMAVDGQPTREMTTDCAVKYISGLVGTAVSLTVHRPGREKDDVVTVLRQIIVLPTVEGSQRADNDPGDGRWDYFLDAEGRIGYLQLNGFTDNTADQARQVLDRLEQNSVAGLIIDVRGNGGGLLSEATAFADLFIGDGPLLSSRGRSGKNTLWHAKSIAVKRDYPIVILIDEGSASAAEIVAGVLAVRKPVQVTLIGQRTYGKGSVQEVADLGPAGGRLKFTSAFYSLPDGRPVQNRYKLQPDGRTDWGVAPHIEIALYASERSQIQQLQTDRRKHLMDKDPHPEIEAQSESLVQQMLAIDPHLATALVVLKAKILAGDEAALAAGQL